MSLLTTVASRLRITSASSTRGHSAQIAVVWVAVVAGCAIRVAYWWQDKSFWRDELALIQSLDTFSLGDLLGGPLADAQSAPPGWLLLERLTTIVFGTGERAYRLLPLIFGCGVLVLTALLALRFVRRPWTAAIPVVALATLSQVVFYTVQAKQYTMDMFLVTGLVLVAVRLVRSEPTRRLEILWYIGLAVFPWFSHGFMLAAPVVAGWVAVVQWRKGYRSLPRLALGLAGPAVSVLLAALWAKHLTSLVPDFQSYWASFMRTRGTGIDGLVSWNSFVLNDFALRNLGVVAWWGLGFFALGLAGALWRRWSRTSAVLLVLPAIPPYFAGVFDAYPFGRRLVLFCVPALLVLLGVLVDVAVGVVVGRLARVPPRRWPGPAAGALCVAVLALFAWITPSKMVHDLRYSYGVDDYRVALQHISSEWRAGDVLIMGNGDRAAFRVYGTRLRMPADTAFRAMPSPSTEERVGCPLPPEISGASRIWLMSGDLTTVYEGERSRTALALPLLDRFRVVWFEDKGLVTKQALLPGGSSAEATPARCLNYAPVGPVGAPKFPPALPTAE